MYDAERVEVLGTKTDLTNELDTVRLCQGVFLISDPDEQLPALKILHEDDDGREVRVAVHIADDILVTQGPEDSYLLLRLLPVGSSPGLDDLGGKTIPGFLFPDKINHAEPTFSELIKKRLSQQNVTVKGK